MTATQAVAVLGTVLAALVLLPGPPRRPRAASGPSRSNASPAEDSGTRTPSGHVGSLGLSPRSAGWWAGTGAVLTALAWGDRQLLVLTVLLGELVWGVLGAWRRGRIARESEARRARVVDLCEALAGELRAGQPLVVALERCAQVWPDAHRVARAARWGGDVPGAFAGLARAPGAEGLQEVAAAFRVTERSGAGLSAALGQVAASARARQAARRVVIGELASARATARLVALLPVAVLLMAAGIGTSPWTFLLGTVPGAACAVVGVGLVLAGLWWLDRISAGVLR